jgi:hypothetical protein
MSGMQECQPLPQMNALLPANTRGATGSFWHARLPAAAADDYTVAYRNSQRHRDPPAAICLVVYPVVAVHVWREGLPAATVAYVQN